MHIDLKNIKTKTSYYIKNRLKVSATRDELYLFYFKNIFVNRNLLNLLFVHD